MNKQDVIDYIVAATAFYGVVPMAKVGELFTRHTATEFHQQAVRIFAEEEEQALRSRFVRTRGDLFVFESIEEFNQLSAYLERSHRKRYFVPELEELLRYQDDFYVEMTEQAKMLQAYLVEEIGLDGEMAEELLLGVKSAASEPGTDLFRNLAKGLPLGRLVELPDMELERVLFLAANMFNHCRSWVHRGKTPIEADEPLVLPSMNPIYPEDVQGVLTNYIKALVHLYGAVQAEKVAEIYNKQNDGRVTADNLLAMAKTLSPAARLAAGAVHIDGDWFISEALTGPGKLEELIGKTEGKPYYIPDQQSLLRYADKDYYEETPQVIALKNFASRNFFGGDSFRAGIWMNLIHPLIPQGELPEDAFTLIQEFGGFTLTDEQQAYELLGLYFDMANHSRWWQNRGHTPKEMLEYEQLQSLPAVSTKVGRNEPCPCGSGKKFKKCCGK